MSSAPINVGVVGLGWWSDVLANCTEDRSFIKFTTCFSRSKEKRQKFAEDFDCEAAGSLEEMLATPGLDGVVITTPNNAHLEIVRAAAKAGNTSLSKNQSRTTSLKPSKLSESAANRG